MTLLKEISCRSIIDEMRIKAVYQQYLWKVLLLVGNQFYLMRQVHIKREFSYWHDCVQEYNTEKKRDIKRNVEDMKFCHRVFHFSIRIGFYILFLHSLLRCCCCYAVYTFTFFGIFFFTLQVQHTPRQITPTLWEEKVVGHVHTDIRYSTKKKGKNY